MIRQNRIPINPTDSINPVVEDCAWVTELASLHAVTKGAISQTLKKLEARELAAKKADPANSSRLLVELTAEGEKAYRACHKNVAKK